MKNWKAALGKLLDQPAVVFFAALAVLAGLADASVRNWLGLWSGELSNAAIAAIAGLSLAVRKPFTLAYARESTDRKYWNSPLFLRINYVTPMHARRDHRDGLPDHGQAPDRAGRQRQARRPEGAGRPVRAGHAG
jgi:hypothetical protein